MKLSKEQKITKEKLAALTSKGALMMLVDYLKQFTTTSIFDITFDKSVIASSVVKNAAKLRVQYLNNITPVEENVKQIDLEEAIEKVKSKG